MILSKPKSSNGGTHKIYRPEPKIRDIINIKNTHFYRNMLITSKVPLV